jgi:hypothetical protein
MQEEKNYRKGIVKMGRLRLVFFMCIFFLLLSGMWTQASLEEIEEAPPFPSGKNAKLVKKACGYCHDAATVIYRTYDEKSANDWYDRMMSDPDPEQRKKIIEYLTTVLG